MVISVWCGKGRGHEENAAADCDMDMTSQVEDPQPSAEQKTAAKSRTLVDSTKAVIRAWQQAIIIMRSCGADPSYGDFEEFLAAKRRKKPQELKRFAEENLEDPEVIPEIDRTEPTCRKNVIFLRFVFATPCG
jgi:hypothetical protein